MCGCHVDNLSCKKPDREPSDSLENKICFRTKGSRKFKFGSSRFGGGQGFLTYSILDWKGNLKTVRRAAELAILATESLVSLRGHER